MADAAPDNPPASAATIAARILADSEAELARYREFAAQYVAQAQELFARMAKANEELRAALSAPPGFPGGGG